MNKLFTLLVLLAVSCLTSCLEYESRIQVKPDGSGYIIETLKSDNTTAKYSRAILSAMKEKGVDVSEHEAKLEMFKEQKLRENSAKYGEGVTYVSGQAIKEEEKEGYTATYTFPDITKLMIGKKSLLLALSATMDDDKIKSDKIYSQPGPGVDPFDKLDFTFTQGSPSVLNFNLLSAEDIQQFTNTELSEPAVQDSMSSELGLSLIKMYVQDAHIRFIVEPLGTIVETNASYRDGSHITLLDIDFTTILKNPQKAPYLPMLMSIKQKNFEEYNTFLTETPGIKGQTGDVWVKFK